MGLGDLVPCLLAQKVNLVLMYKSPVDRWLGLRQSIRFIRVRYTRDTGLGFGV